MICIPTAKTNTAGGKKRILSNYFNYLSYEFDNFRVDVHS